MRPSFFKAKKSICTHGHKHDSGSEAKRCTDLHVMQSAGLISALEVHPVFYFRINGTPVKMANGHTMKFTGDFGYLDADGVMVVEDVKPKGGFTNQSRDVPVKLALLKHLYPHISWRIHK